MIHHVSLGEAGIEIKRAFLELKVSVFLGLVTILNIRWIEYKGVGVEEAIRLFLLVFGLDVVVVFNLKCNLHLRRVWSRRRRQRR